MTVAQVITDPGQQVCIVSFDHRYRLRCGQDLHQSAIFSGQQVPVAQNRASIQEQPGLATIV